MADPNGNTFVLDSRPQSHPLHSVPPYTTLGQFSYAPATQTTVVTTTTTTTTAFPPLVLKAPRQLSELDPKLYPLAPSATPSSIKRFCFDLGGRPTYFREADNVEETLEEIKQKHESLEASNGILRTVQQQEPQYKASDPFATNRSTPLAQLPDGATRSSSRKGSTSSVSILEAANIAKVHRDDENRHKSSTLSLDLSEREIRHQRSCLHQVVTPATPDIRTSPLDRIHRADRPHGRPTDSLDIVEGVSSGSLTTSRDAGTGTFSTNPIAYQMTSRPEKDTIDEALVPTTSSIATSSGFVVATPPVTETDLQSAHSAQRARPKSTKPMHLNLLDTTAAQDLSLPSPTLSPVTAANNPGVKHEYFDNQNEEQDGVVSEHESTSLRGQTTKGGSTNRTPSKTMQLRPGDIRRQRRLGLIDKDSARAATPTLMDIPSMLDAFDAMPNEMKTYVMYQMLRRCPKPTLHFVAEVVNPALKCDFVALLPLELSLNILKHLDVRSLCRAAQVSKRWRNVVDSDEQAWKDLFDRDGYSLDEGELKKAIREGWGWQHPHGLNDWERDISASSVPNWKSDSERSNASGTSSTTLTSATAAATSSLALPRQSGRPKRKSTGKTSSRKLQKRKESGKETLDTGKFDSWMQQLSVAEGPYAAANAAILAVPNPTVGLPSLRKMHLYKTIYQRHHLIRRSWTESGIKPRHIAFRAHHNHVVTCLQFDTDKILTGSDDTNINVYDTKTGALRKRLEGHEGGVWALQYEGNVLVSGSTDRSVRVWDIEKGICTQVFQGHTSTVRCLQILMPEEVGQTASGRAIMMPKQPLIITGSRDSNLRVWKLPKSSDRSFYQAGPPANDTDGPYFVQLLTGHNHSVRAIAAYGDTLVSGSYDCTVRVWKISTGDTVHRLTGHTQKVYSVVLDHKRNRCISGSMDNLVKVWSLETGSVLFNLEGHSSLVGLLDLSDDRLVSAAADSTLRIWDPENGQCKSTLSAHTGAITCFQHDGHKVVSGSDRTLKMWNVRTGECVKDLLTDLSGVWQVKFNARRCVAAVQRGMFTYIEVLDFGASRDGVPKAKLGRRLFVNAKGQEASDPGEAANDTEAAGLD